MDSISYWNDVAGEWRTKRPQRLWRECSDRQQLALVGRWLGPTIATKDGGSGPRLLKTDLFDEVAGAGLVPRLLADGFRVTGIDISPAATAAAAACHPGLDAVAADVRLLPFPDVSFDVVFSGSTLDHFDAAADIRRALAEIRRVLRPGGRFVITLDNPANPLVRLRNGPLLRVLRRVGIVPYSVGATLGRRDLQAALAEAGFVVVASTAVLHCPRVVAVALAALVDRLGAGARTAFMRGVEACERLEALPTRWVTGHYVAMLAVAAAPPAGTGPFE